MLDEDVTKCLNCNKPQCTNCLKSRPPSRKRFWIEKVDPDTGKVVETYRSYAAAAELNLVSERTIRRYLSMTTPNLGFIWRRVEVTKNNV